MTRRMCRATTFVLTAQLAAVYINDKPWWLVGIITILIAFTASTGWKDN